jgi:hypothetical protein
MKATNISLSAIVLLFLCKYSFAQNIPFVANPTRISFFCEFERAFTEKDTKSIESLLYEGFKNNPYYSTLLNYVSLYKVNTNYCTSDYKKFFINKTDATKGVTVTFVQRKPNDVWLVQDATNVQSEKEQVITNKSLSSMDEGINFKAFLDKSSNMVGIAPYGKLNNTSNLETTDVSQVVLKNLIIYDTNGKIIDFIYLKIKYFEANPTLKGLQAGFLIIDAGSQKDLYKQEEDLFLKYKVYGDLGIDVTEKNKIICAYLEKEETTISISKAEEININIIRSNPNQDRIVIEFDINDTTKLRQITEAFNSKKSFTNGKITLPLVHNNLKFVFKQSEIEISEKGLRKQNITLVSNQENVVIQLSKEFTTLQNFTIGEVKKDDDGNVVFKIYALLK